MDLKTDYHSLIWTSCSSSLLGVTRQTTRAKDVIHRSVDERSHDRVSHSRLNHATSHPSIKSIDQQRLIAKHNPVDLVGLKAALNQRGRHLLEGTRSLVGESLGTGNSVVVDVVALDGDCAGCGDTGNASLRDDLAGVVEGFEVEELDGAAVVVGRDLRRALYEGALFSKGGILSQDQLLERAPGHAVEEDHLHLPENWV